MKLAQPKVVVPAVTVVTAIGMVGGFYLWANAPQQGRVTNTTPYQIPVVPKDKLLEATYFQFEYGGNYLMKKEIAANGDLERYTLSADTKYDKRILAFVSPLPPKGIEYNGAYILRKSSPGVYAMRTLTIKNVAYTIWVKNDGTEQTVMIPKGKQFTTISIVTANPQDNLTLELDALLTTYQWKK